MTNANYIEAVKVLKERNGQSSEMIQAHMQTIIDITPPNNDLATVTFFKDRIETSIPGLEAFALDSTGFNNFEKAFGRSKATSSTRTWITYRNIVRFTQSYSYEIYIIEADQDYGIKQSFYHAYIYVSR